MDCANFLHANKINFSTDVITYNPFETEKDLNDTLNVLIELPKPFDLDVNKLYVIKGTGIEQLLSNNEPTKLMPDNVINLYTRLFWLTKFSKGPSQVFYLLKNNAFVRKFPFLINPYLLNLPYKVINFVHINIQHFLLRLYSKLGRV